MQLASFVQFPVKPADTIAEVRALPVTAAKGNAVTTASRPVSGQYAAIADCAELVPRSIPQKHGPSAAASPSIERHKSAAYQHVYH